VSEHTPVGMRVRHGRRLANSWPSRWLGADTPGHCSVGVTPLRNRPGNAARSRWTTGDNNTGDDAAANAPLIRIVSSNAPTAGADNAGVRRATTVAGPGAVREVAPGDGAAPCWLTPGVPGARTGAVFGEVPPGCEVFGAAGPPRFGVVPPFAAAGGAGGWRDFPAWVSMIVAAASACWRSGSGSGT
jgi:hypothetical protein